MHFNVAIKKSPACTKSLTAFSLNIRNRHFSLYSSQTRTTSTYKYLFVLFRAYFYALIYAKTLIFFSCAQAAVEWTLAEIKYARNHAHQIYQINHDIPISTRIILKITGKKAIAASQLVSHLNILLPNITSKTQLHQYVQKHQTKQTHPCTADRYLNSLIHTPKTHT